MIERSKEYIKGQIEKLIEDTWNVKVKLDECHIISMPSSISTTCIYDGSSNDNIINGVYINFKRFVLDETDCDIRRMGFRSVDNKNIVLLDSGTFEEIM